MGSAFSQMLGRVVRTGQLELVEASGAVARFGDGAEGLLRVRLADAVRSPRVMPDAGALRRLGR